MPLWVAELAKNLNVVPPVEIKDKTLPGVPFRKQLQSCSIRSPLGVLCQGGWSVIFLQGHTLEAPATQEDFFNSTAKLADEVCPAGAESLFSRPCLRSRPQFLR